MNETAPTPRPPRRHLAGSILWVAVDRVAATAAIAFTSIGIARLLGPAGTGTYALSATLLYIAVTVFDLGLVQGTAYFVGRREWSGRPLALGVIGSSALLGALGAGAMLVGYALLGDHLPGVTWPMAIALAVALPWALTSRFSASAALAQERFELYGLLDPAAVVLALPLSLVAAALVGIAPAVYGLAAAAVIAGCLAGGWLIASTRGAGHPPASPPGGAQAVARFGLAAWLSELLQQVNYRADLVLLAVLTTAADTGVYSVAVSITSLAWVLSGAFATSVFPRSARLSAESEHGETTAEERDQSDARTVRHTVLLIPPLALMEVVLLLVALPLIYGSEFHRSIGLGFVLLPGSLILGVGIVALAILLGHGRTDRVIMVGLATVPATLLAYALVVPPLGATGAALVSSISYICFTLFAVATLHKSTGLGVRNMLLPRREDLGDYRVVASGLQLGLRRLLNSR